MADAVTSQTLVDGKRNVVMLFTNVSDSTGEAAVTKVDISALSGAPTDVAIERIIATTSGMSVNILWDATTDVLAWGLPDGMDGEIDFRSFGGLINPQASGSTGDIKFTTTGATAGDTYSIILHLTKRT